MIVKLEDRITLINKAAYLMDKYSLSEFEAIKCAEYEIEKQMGKGDLKYEE